MREFQNVCIKMFSWKSSTKFGDWTYDKYDSLGSVPSWEAQINALLKPLWIITGPSELREYISIHFREGQILTPDTLSLIIWADSINFSACSRCKHLAELHIGAEESCPGTLACFLGSLLWLSHFCYEASASQEPLSNFDLNFLPVNGQTPWPLHSPRHPAELQSRRCCSCVSVGVSSIHRCIWKHLDGFILSRNDCNTALYIN